MTNRSLNTRVVDVIGRQEASGNLPPGAGVAIAVLRDRDLPLSETFGFRDRERELPVTPGTIFEVGSITKAFTAIAALIASEDGRLDLDGPINRSRAVLTLADFRLSREMTIGDILAHRTGLPSNDLLWYFGHLRSHNLLDLVAQIEPLPNAFRRAFSYNNTMYAVLGHLFTELVGESWESYVTRRILEPLHMTSTVFHISERQQNVAVPYIGTRRAKRMDLTVIGAAGAIKSSLEDMTRWMAFLMDGRNAHEETLLSARSLAVMQSPQMAVDFVHPLIQQGLEWLGPDLKYGYGWFLGSIRGVKVAYHPGFIDGFSTAAAIVPEKRTACVVLANVNLSRVPELLVQDLLSELIPSEKQTAAVPEVTRPFHADSSLVGKYQDPVFGVVSIAVDGQLATLTLTYMGNQWPLRWTGENAAECSLTVFGLEFPCPVRFDVDSGKVVRLTMPFSLDPRAPDRVFTRMPD